MFYHSYRGNISGVRILAMLVCFLCCASAQAGVVLQGRAFIQDGDTIEIGRQSIRIWGIDAVELKQSCKASFGTVACGRMARDALTNIIAGRDVSCVPKGKSYQRVVATCLVDGIDVAAAMTRLGMAHDYTHYSHGFYAADEDTARQARAGIWAMRFEDPAHWRACHLRQWKRHRPADCLS